MVLGSLLAWSGLVTSQLDMSCGSGDFGLRRLCRDLVSAQAGTASGTVNKSAGPCQGRFCDAASAVWPVRAGFGHLCLFGGLGRRVGVFT